MSELQNQKHEIFAQELAKGKTADEAYVLAGYKESRSNASVLRTNQNIIDRIRELQEAATLRAEVTIASLMREAAEIQRLATEDKQYSAANAALTAKAKLAGLWVERSENDNVNTNYVVSGEPIDSVEEWEEQFAPKH